MGLGARRVASRHLRVIAGARPQERPPLQVQGDFWVRKHEDSKKHLAMLPAWRAERAAANSPASSASVEAVVVAQESETSARLCEGLDLDSADQTVLFASVVQSCRLWLDSDCIDTTKEQPFVLAARPDNGKLMLRSRSCADRKTPLLCPVGRGWCLECERAAQSRKNLLHVCGWAFKMDQVRLLHLLLQRRTEDAQDLLSEMAAADYQQHVRVDLHVLREMDYTAMLHRVRNLFASIRQDRRNPALAHFVKARVDWLTFHMGEVQHKPEHRAVVERLARGLSSGQNHPGEVQVATLIAEVALRGHDLLQALVLFMVSMCDKPLGR
eukprot:s2078_g4.t1